MNRRSFFGLMAVAPVAIAAAPAIVGTLGETIKVNTPMRVFPTPTNNFYAEAFNVALLSYQRNFGLPWSKDEILTTIKTSESPNYNIMTTQVTV